MTLDLSSSDKEAWRSSDLALADALIAARLVAADPAGLGGLVLRGGGARREAVTAALRDALPPGAAVRRLPVDADDDRLIGGLDLGLALAGRGVRPRPGLLGEADGGLIVAPMAERMSAATAARLAGALDTIEVRIERDGAALAVPARFAVVALDDGIEGEAVPAALAERLAFHVDLDAKAPPAAQGGAGVAEGELFELLAGVSVALGVESVRALLFAHRAARGAARLDGRAAVNEADVRLAVRLVLGPRATRAPVAAPPPEDAPPPPEDSADGQEDGAEGTLDERVLDAARAILPADLLAALAGGGAGSGRNRARAAARRGAPTRGRPAGTRAGVPGGGRRLALAETLRAAVPWQRLRGRTDRVLVRLSDLRVRRFEPRPQATTIVAVDASGSAAMARLAEAKGAVELLLSQAYVQRAEVALLAFRGTAAELLLPPTRSLTRARRALADLPGGGGTPLAAGISAARDIAVRVRAKGRTPLIVLLSDGRGNIAADGSAGRAAAERDATAAARAVAVDGLAAVFIDTSARVRPEAARLAGAMRARYIALPYAGAEAIGAAVGAVRVQTRSGQWP